MSRRIAILASALLGLLTAAALAGCESSFVGTLNLNLSGVVSLEDTQNVVLAVTGVEVGGDGGRTNFDFSSHRLVDLDAGSTTILTALVPAGDYKWVRLKIDSADSYVIASNGGRYALDAPDILQSTQQFVVGEGLMAKMQVDLDLRKALSFALQGGVRVYTLAPVSRLVDLESVSNIAGSVPTTLTIGALSVNDLLCDPEVYAYMGAGVVPEGFFVPVKGGTAPFASSSLSLHVNQNIYSFNVAQLPPSTYTVAVTCAAADVPGSTSIGFSPTQTAVVVLGKSTLVAF